MQFDRAALAQRGRPAGDVRREIVSVLQRDGALAQRDIAERTQVGYEACSTTLKNAVRAGQLEIVGHEKRAHCKQWVALYALAAEAAAEPVQPAILLLDAAIGAWR